MKSVKFLFYFFLVLLCQNLAAEEVFNGEHTVGSWSAKTLSAENYNVLKKVNAGDVLAVTVSEVSDNTDAWVVIQTSSWQLMADYQTQVSDATTVCFVLNETTAADVKANGINLTGKNYTFTKVEVFYHDKTIWTGSVNDNEGWTQSAALDATLFAGFSAGDLIGVTISAINDGADWHQYAVRSNYVNVCAGSVQTASTFAHKLTADQLSALKAGPVDLAAQYLCVSALETYKAEQSGNSEDIAGETFTAWTGSTTFGPSWSAWEQIPAAKFANAKEGMYIRFKFKDVKAGAQFKLSTSEWKDMPDAPLVNIKGVYQQYTITADMLEKLQSGGGIVSGINFTLTAVEVINPADIKALTLSVPVTSDWVFADKPNLEVNITNPYAESVAAKVVAAITTDQMVSVATIEKNVNITAGANQNIAITTESNLEPGIYKATITVNDELAREFFFAINPTDIVSAPDKQADFENYWAAAKEQLAAIEATDEPILIELNGENGTVSKSTATRKVYLVQFKSIPDGTSGDPVTIRGYYVEPTDGKKHPVIMHFLGYDSAYAPGGTEFKPYCPSGDGDTSDYAEFYLSCRGQSLNNRAANERESDGQGDFTNSYGDWFAFNFGNKDSYYYRGAYMDCVRAIDFMATRPTSDMTNLYAEGQSQGGAFTVAAAALSGREFKAIAPAITFMGDFPDYFNIVNWPAHVARDNQGTMTDAEMFAFLSYFDTKNLAPSISCPIITSVGLQDDVCPVHTNLAPFNNVATDTDNKQIIYNPVLKHQTPSDWFTRYMNFFEQYRSTIPDEPTGIDALTEQTETNTSAEIYTLDGRRVNHASKGVYIIKNKLFLQ